MENDAKYQVITDWLQSQIDNKVYNSGDRIPSENELCKQFSMSRSTVRRAIFELEKEGIVTKVKGSGTYVGATSHVLRDKQYQRIAVISTYIDSYIFPHILKGIEKVLSNFGYQMQLSVTNDRVADEERILKDIISVDHYDGIIVEPTTSSLPSPNLDLYREIFSKHIPVIFFNANYKDLYIDTPSGPSIPPCVRLDDEDAGEKATNYLINKGHRKIAGIFRLDDGQGQLRYAGYIKALKAADITLLPQLCVWLDTYSIRHLGEMKDYLFSRLSDASAIFCYNDEVADSVISMALEMGIRIPEDISIISIDDSELAQRCEVPFTSVSHPKKELGERVAGNLLSMREGAFFDASYLYKGEIIERDSVVLHKE
ncbi:MAG: GntR family transcriptional regulator [Lachnospiraceae bacterium]|nr:GntR family transcriptional regulator [Lachnospiraceae bacterium]